MQTRLADFIKDTPLGKTADEILRKCVHCGFCTATCPTYQLLGDELDSPRGRIYLIKQMLEGDPVSVTTQTHLDRCLTCRACETTCPSGVRYGRLAEIGRELVEERVKRPFSQQVFRWLLRKIVAYPTRFTPILRIGQWLRVLLPRSMRRRVPLIRTDNRWPAPRHARRMLILDGCVQPGIAPHFNAAAARVLDQVGISLLRPLGAGCCGAVSLHLSAGEEAREQMRRNIDVFCAHLDQGVEAIVSTASACALTMKEYRDQLGDDPVYTERAARVSAAVKDLAEVVAKEQPVSTGAPTPRRRIAFHAPCTLQHGQKINGAVEKILQAQGFELTPVAQGHLCCGSAGTYSILQPELSASLLQNKLATLEAGDPDIIATANIGCYTHLMTRAQIPVLHWIELLDQAP